MFEHKNNVREHFFCVKQIFNLYKTQEQLKGLQARPDLDTVCAFDYIKMKSYAMDGEGLKYEDYHPEAKGITVPKLE